MRRNKYLLRKSIAANRIPAVKAPGALIAYIINLIASDQSSKSRTLSACRARRGRGTQIDSR